MDGLEAEREQGITIDVAYRFFSTPKRKFIVADTPGHEQYTRNMATGASTADLAIVLVDARKGMLRQTRRHSYIASLLGIRHIILAVNKIDLVDYSQDVFDKIVTDYQEFASKIWIQTIQAIPLSARFGDNVIGRLPTCPGTRDRRYCSNWRTFRWTARRSTSFPLSGAVGQPSQLGFSRFFRHHSVGPVAPGDEVALPNPARSSRVKRIVTWDGDLARLARARRSPSLDDEIEVSRGNMLVGTRCKAGSRRPVRCQRRVVRRTCADTGSFLYAEARNRSGHCDDHRSQVSRSISTVSSSKRPSPWT